MLWSGLIRVFMNDMSSLWMMGWRWGSDLMMCSRMSSERSSWDEKGVFCFFRWDMKTSSNRWE